MKNDFTTRILVDQQPDKVFAAITNVRGWWSEDIEGSASKLNDQFFYHYKDIHQCTIKLTEVIPGKKIVWFVEDNYFKFTRDKEEWIGNRMVFEINRKGDQTELVFTQEGLVPGYECYEVCRDAWTNYVTGSLRDLIVKGKGNPNPKDKEGEINKKVMEQNKIHFKSN